MERKASTARSDLEQLLVDETAEPKALPLSLLEDITGDFSDDQEIGRGGFAVVYKVKHKHVVRFLGYCADTQGNIEPYNGELVMADVRQRLLCFEYIPKGSLDGYINDAHREWETCYKIIKGICEGLQYLHDNRIIHVDLKPTNILLDNDMVPKITDFGLSRRLGENQSRVLTKTISGTTGYLAPECYEGKGITRSVDLYSLGVIIIEILTGKKGHQDTEDVLESWSDRLERSQQEEIRICYETALECTEFNPKKRPASAQDIIDRLHKMESILTAEAASSTSGVAATESKGKSNTDDPMFRFLPAAGRDAHPLAGQTVAVPRPTGPAGPYHGPQDDRRETLAAASSDPVASTSRALAAESKGKSKDEPRVFRSVSASSEPRHAMLHAMATPQPPHGQTAVMSCSTPVQAAPQGSADSLVEPMSYLYVSVVKARDLPTMDIIGALDPYVEVKLGNFKDVTEHLEKTHNPVWRQTFAFSADHLQSNQLEVIVKDKDTLRNDFVGRVLFDMPDIPSRLPPDSPLPPQWYTLSDANGELFRHGHGLGEIMLAVWLGTQADEAFPEAWHSDAHSLSQEGLTNTRSKVYHSPKLIYLKVSVIAAQDLIAAEKDQPLALAITKIQMGSQIRRTRPGQRQGWENQAWNEEFMFVACGSENQAWNEEFMFLASEPFDDPLVVTVEEKVAAGRDEPIGRIIIPVASPHVPRNDLAKSVPSKWFNLSHGMTVDEAAADVTTGTKHRESSKTIAGKIHLSMSLETAYHVLDEPMHYISDLQPAAEMLRKSAIGILEVGILNARGLDGNKNPYCVAKYGATWVRTRTLLGTAAPEWNELHTFEVFDLSTVITVAVFDNNHVHHDHDAKDQRIGKVRVQLATLESGRGYMHYFPLMTVTPSGLKKMGELHLAVRFTCTAWRNMLAQYRQPRLPEMHYTNPISVPQLDDLRFQAMQMVATELGRVEPPLHREVVEYMLDVDSHMFSLHRSKANINRITSLFFGAVAFGEWFDGIRKWKNPLTTILVHVVFLSLVYYPELILPTAFLCLFMIERWNYLRRQAKLTHPNELDEAFEFHSFLWCLDELDKELDTFPTSKPEPDDIVCLRLKYDQLRRIAGVVQTVIGHLASQAEQAQSLLRWRDTRLTAIFMTLLLVMAVILYLTPLWVVAMVMGLYVLRHPEFRGGSTDQLLFNLCSRLPSKDDLML